MNEREECLKLVDELNESIVENKFFENLGMSFTYSTNGYEHLIDFGDFNLYCSQLDSLSKYDYFVDDWVDISLKEFVIQKLIKFSGEMLEMSQNILKIKVV